MKYLIISAHPDDEVLGCGGSMAKWSKEGNEVHVLIMAEGITSRDKERDKSLRKNELSLLGQSARKAADILGVSSLKLLDNPDNRMDSMDLLDVVKPLEKYIFNINPDVVVTHHSSDLNIDHQIIHKATMVACRPQPNSSIKRIMSFEVPSSTEWQSYTYGNSFQPTLFENISKTLKEKVKALEEYKSEMREWPHPRSIKAIEHLARWRGSSMGVEAAEAFVLLREIKK